MKNCRHRFFAGGYNIERCKDGDMHYNLHWSYVVPVYKNKPVVLNLQCEGVIELSPIELHIIASSGKV